MRLAAPLLALIPLLALVHGATPLAAAQNAQKQRPPTGSEQKKLLRAFFELDPRSAEAADEGRKILAHLDRLPALSPRQARDWRKKILKQAAKGRRLDKKNLRSWLWEKEKKGLYIIGGETKKPRGLLVAMHGGGAGSGSAQSAYGAYSAAAKKLGLLAVFPEVLKRTEHGWTDSGTEEFVLDLTAAARRTWKIDPDRVFFAGHSMGGYGTWTLGAHHADWVAALAPAAGAPTPIFSRETRKVIDVVEGVIPNLRNVLIVVYQSDDDPRVGPEPNRMAVKKLAAAQERWGGYHHEYWEVSGRGHASPPGGTIAHLQKIVGNRRDPCPKKIVWQPTLPWKRQFYWLWWEQPVPEALVVAEVDQKKNRIRVECDHDAATLSVLLDDRLVDMSKEVVVELGGKEVFRGVPERRLTTILLTGVGNDPGLVFEARVAVARR